MDYVPLTAGSLDPLTIEETRKEKVKREDQKKELEEDLVALETKGREKFRLHAEAQKDFDEAEADESKAQNEVNAVAAKITPHEAALDAQRHVLNSPTDPNGIIQLRLKSVSTHDPDALLALNEAIRELADINATLAPLDAEWKAAHDNLDAAKNQKALEEAKRLDAKNNLDKARDAYVLKKNEISQAATDIGKIDTEITHKVDQEAELSRLAGVVQTGIDAYIARPNAYDAIKTVITDPKSTSIAGTRITAIEPGVSEKENAEEFIKAINIFESQYSQLPENARAPWQRRMERRAYYANLADKVRDNHQAQAQSYADLTAELRERRKRFNAYSEVMDQIRQERDIFKLNYEGQHHTKGFFSRIAANVTFTYTRKWLGNWWKQNSLERTFALRKHYQEQTKNIKSKEKAAVAARKALRQRIDKAARNALKK